ncbi:hypothetical protein G7Y89_g1953 [Cudoniella acicularis]|uniref:Cytochrome P450 n=1 Tax=Cudoniella acicularis TaxID=354080 RepID=A0A8H4RW69_9HELO|nr:hypothetical protein G7Y89_g1953 [Cudoniella acicularis]
MTSEIVLTTPEHIKSVFRDSDKHFKAVDNNSGFFMHEILGQCVGLISGAKWKAVKTAVEIPFIHQNIRNHVSSVQRHTKEYFKVLEGKGNLSKRKLDPVADIKMLPFWIIVDIIYGGLSPGMEAQLCKLAPQREELFKFVIHGGLTRFWFSRLLPLKANKELKAFKHDWKAFNDSAYRHALELGIKTPFVSMHHAIERGEISEDQLLQTLDEMIFANLDVTMGGISWNLVFLAANPHIQDQLRDEIGEQRSLAAIDVEKFNNYLVSSSSLLAACVLESARLKPLAAFSVPQAAPTDRIIDGYRIPALTNFLVDTCALNITNPFWGPDSTIYRPGRFLERKGPELRYNYWRFGFGPRQCMGKYVADLIIHSILVHTLENYTLRTEATAEDWKWVMDTWINNPDIILHCEARKKSMKSFKNLTIVYYSPIIAANIYVRLSALCCKESFGGYIGRILHGMYESSWPVIYATAESAQVLSEWAQAQDRGGSLLMR